jgi:hypothetical protein
MKYTGLVAASLCVWAGTGMADDTADLAQKAQNPIAALYSLPIQFNWNQHMGPTNDGIQAVTNIQPVLPFSINEDWNLISRTILPVIDQRSLAPNGLADKSGLGDRNGTRTTGLRTFIRSYFTKCINRWSGDGIYLAPGSGYFRI